MSEIFKTQLPLRARVPSETYGPETAVHRHKMKNYIQGLACVFLLMTMNLQGQTADGQAKPDAKTMNTPPLSLGYVILYVKDVEASLEFYEKAFGLTRRVFHDENGKAYGELETGTARLAFASVPMAKEQLKQEVTIASADKAPLGFEVALVTADVTMVYARAVKAGAISVSEPASKPWGQTVAYVRDNCGHVVELCTPLP